MVDEGVTGSLRIMGNVLRYRDARRRVIGMWKVWRRHRRSLIAVSVIARRPREGEAS